MNIKTATGRCTQNLLVGTALVTAFAAAADPARAAVATQESPGAVQFNIPAQNLGGALTQFARQSGQQLLFAPDLVAGKRSNAVVGSFTPREGLTRLLSGSGIGFRISPSGAYLLGNGAGPATSAAVIPISADQDDSNNSEIVVTGTNIRGAQVPSPVVSINAQEIRRSGHNDLGEVLRALPQNFSGGQNPGVTSGASAGGAANQNISGGSSLNLRGLGPDATLTLLNGTRLPYDGLYQATDISGIPLGAIDRIELVLDGASAIYGSDAVAGVANIVLRRDFDGAEISVRHGIATSGGLDQTQLTGVAGTTWQSGGFLVAGDHLNGSAIRAADRRYLSYLPNQAVTLYPDIEQSSALFSAHQRLGSDTELSLEALYVTRDADTLEQSFGTRTAIMKRSEVWLISPTLTTHLTPSWSLRITGSIGQNNLNQHFVATSAATGALQSDYRDPYENHTYSAGIDLQGPLLALPGGDLRLAIGAGYRRNTFEASSVGVPLAHGVSRSYSAFAEVAAPVISPRQAISGIYRLTITGAARYETYNQFGDVITPKLGAIWGITRSLGLRASWGESFKVPTLLQQYQSQAIALRRASSFDSTAPATATVLTRSGGSLELKPERAETFSIGVDFTPTFIPGLSIHASYFEISYRDRVVLPIGSLFNALRDPVFADFVTRNPTAVQQSDAIAAAARFNNFAGAPYNAANVIAIVDNRYTNAALQNTRGADFLVTYSTDLLGGEATLLGNASWIESRRRQSSLAPFTPASGVAYFPAEFRARAGGWWTHDGLTIAAHANYVAGILDTNVTPRVDRKAMTTVDLSLGYEGRVTGLGEVGFNLSMINAFNANPPFLQPTTNEVVNYDSTNYSVVGRTISLAVRLRF